jgi:hypothetical protein
LSRFTEVLLVSPLADGRTWVVSRDFGYEVGTEGSGDTVDVAVGFQTDFASIPRMFWVVLPKWGRYGNASIIHDWLYWSQERSRKESDDIFLEAMGVLQVGPFKKHVIYWAVRAFGGIAWLRNQADGAAGFDRVRGPEGLKATSESQRKGTLSRFTRHALRKITRGPSREDAP